VLSPFFIFAVFDVSLVITPLTGVINYVFLPVGQLLNINNKHKH